MEGGWPLERLCWREAGPLERLCSGAPPIMVMLPSLDNHNHLDSHNMPTVGPWSQWLPHGAPAPEISLSLSHTHTLTRTHTHTPPITAAMGEGLGWHERGSFNQEIHLLGLACKHDSGAISHEPQTRQRPT